MVRVRTVPGAGLARAAPRLPDSGAALGLGHLHTDLILALPESDRQPAHPAPTVCGKRETIPQEKDQRNSLLLLVLSTRPENPASDLRLLRIENRQCTVEFLKNAGLHVPMQSRLEGSRVEPGLQSQRNEPGMFTQTPFTHWSGPS